MFNSLQQLSVNQKPLNVLGSFPSHISQPLFGRGIMYGKLGAQDQNIKDSVAETEPQLRRYFQK
jgi:hypothetical protein